MILLPTEKRLDWLRAPIVLMSIVFLNIAVFFLYQTQDAKKYSDALHQYTQGQTNFFANERSAYFDYYPDYYDSVDQITPYEILFDDEFYIYFKENSYIEMDQWQYDNYFYQRDEIQKLILSNSASSFGYIPSNFEITRVFTHMFLHGDIFHLLGNLFFLVLCGFAVEAAIGHLRFLLFYMISGIGAVFAFALFDLNSTTALIGASGAISGVMAMYLVVFKLKKIEFFYWFYFFVGYFKAPALLILPIYIANEIYQYLTMEGSNVAFMAHAGGFVTGAICLGGVQLIYPKTIDIEYIEEDDVEFERLQKLDAIYNRIEAYRFKEASRLIRTYQMEYEDDENLKLIHYHMLGLQQTQEAKNSRTRLAINLLSQKKIENKNLPTIANIWSNNSEVKNQMDLEKLRRLAWRLCDYKDLQHAEEITVHLVENKNDDSIIALLQKLAKEFAEQNNQPKRIKYLKLAQSIHAQGM
ncbi:rhomboid family intramembrane serine protease [Marinicellulosiphila megalodicopiae]|uniref:rhomboid family intramembrane serine protease n=1 Tax=Marinicellulosiphila megalodicopiae TaxID=2724896 RepID=UPI003BB0DA21